MKRASVLTAAPVRPVVSPKQRKHTAVPSGIQFDFARISAPESRSAPPHILFSPVHYEPEYAYPLLVWLHNRGNDERQIMKIMPVVSMRNYVAAAPQGILQCEIETELDSRIKKRGQYSSDAETIFLRTGSTVKKVYDWLGTGEGLSDAEEKVFDCISIAKKNCNIAPHRIFIAGFGTGGTMALRLAFLYPEYFAGVAAFAGTMPGKQLLPRWQEARPLPVLLGSGTANAASSAATVEAMELFHTAGVAVDVREYPCGRELTPEMLQDLNRWMMKIVCG
ncbi:MAG: dienelactone hydrolase family protein [Planctomycetaceae bacterium]|jgi:phospholipase/carboxylesterase|nr:dienelactone hydrolase family protein [Planctomycetaceae bacterium]